MPQTSTDHRKATAERNVEAILDATEALLERGASASTTAVAAEAGVSRVTVYAHFPTRQSLLEGATRRAVQRFRHALASVALEDGDPADALDRLIALAWSEHHRYEAVAKAVFEELGATQIARAHDSLHDPITALIERGRAEGAFRTDLPSAWLLSSYFALVHACGEEVRAGRLDADDAVPILQATLGDLFAGPAGRR